MPDQSVFFKLCINALFGGAQLSFESTTENANNPVLDLQEFYRGTMCVSTSLSDPATTPGGKQITVKVRLLSGKVFSLTLMDTVSIAQMTEKLRAADTNHEVPRGPLRFLRSAKMAEGDSILRDFNPSGDEFVCVPSSKIRVDLSFYEPSYNYNFTNVNDGAKKFTRGGLDYRRPCGYQRLALNVVAMYGNGAWLRDSDVPGEWAVSYHANGKYEGVSLTEYGRMFAQGQNIKLTEAVFSTPDYEFAAKFAEEFTFNGEQYIVLLQNRINSQTITKVKTLNGEMFVNPSVGDVRSYGILYKKKGV